MRYVIFRGYPRYCLAEVDDHFQMVSLLSEEETRKFLTILAAEEPFDWNVNVTRREGYADKIVVDIRLTSYERAYRTMMGQLLKSMNEHKHWLYKAWFDEGDFIFNALNRCKEFLSKRGDICASHCPFQYRYDYGRDKIAIVDEDKIVTRTIKELFAKYRKKPNAPVGYIWSTYLRAL